MLSLKKINLLSAVISLSIIIIYNICYFDFNVNNSNIENSKELTDVVTKQDIHSYIKYEIEKMEEIIDKNEVDSKSWKLKIESIDLNAEIAEGTDSKTLNKYIGHFDESKKENGNVALAAHNRGYDVNYFSRIDELKNGDVIKYFYNGNKYVYEVYKNYIILDTDWSVIESTSDEITLITCVKNKPSYRRCIKGKLIKINNENV